MMPERVVRHLQIIQIEDHDGPEAGYFARQARQSSIEGGAIWESCQFIHISFAFPLEHALMAFHGHYAKMGARGDNPLLLVGRAAPLAKVKGESAENDAAGIANRARPASPQAERKYVVLESGPFWVGLDVGNSDAVSKMG
jgi:hypothetical protein